MKALGYVQIDTLHVVNRAHDASLWARFGSYDMDDFHKLIYTADQRRLYEGWGHADSEIMPKRTTFLTPFDSLFWAWERDQRLWGFKQLLECYKPAAERVYGYFSFPILHKDRLVGRFDLKLERKSGVLQLNALYLEPGIEPDEALVAGVAAVMRDFIAWHGAKSLQIVKSDPPLFGK